MGTIFNAFVSLYLSQCFLMFLSSWVLWQIYWSLDGCKLMIVLVVDGYVYRVRWLDSFSNLTSEEKYLLFALRWGKPLFQTSKFISRLRQIDTTTALHSSQWANYIYVRNEHGQHVFGAGFIYMGCILIYVKVLLFSMEESTLSAVGNDLTWYFMYFKVYGWGEERLKPKLIFVVLIRFLKYSLNEVWKVNEWNLSTQMFSRINYRSILVSKVTSSIIKDNLKHLDID